MKFSLTVLLSALFFSALPCAAALADDSAVRDSMAVSYADLDLSRAEDAATALGRLQYAAGRVCGVDNDLRTTRERRRARACMSEAVRMGLGAAKSRTLSRAYAEWRRNDRPALPQSRDLVEVRSGAARVLVSAYGLDMESIDDRQRFRDRVSAVAAMTCIGIGRQRAQCIARAVERAEAAAVALIPAPPMPEHQLAVAPVAAEFHGWALEERL